jgi:hypothetical protein
MKYIFTTRSFLENEDAISEEFTVLPALSIVMIGFAVFALLVAQTYIVTTENLERLQHYQTADHILQRITNPESAIVFEGGCIDAQSFQSENEFLKDMLSLYTKSGICFLLRLQYDNHTNDFPTTTLDEPLQYIAVEKEVAIYLNEAQTVPGRLSIILWEGCQ